MTAKFQCVQGDVNDTAVAQLTGVATFVGATVVGHIWIDGGAEANLTASVVDGVTTKPVPGVPLGSPCGICTVQYGTWLATAEPSLGWKLEYQVTLADGRVLTWPKGAPDTVEVRADGA